MIRSIFKGAGLWGAAMGVCAALLLAVCALVPQSAITPAMQQAEKYFSAMDGSALLIESNMGSRVDEYADIALLDVIWHVDAQRPLYSMIAAPYYRNDGGDIRQDFRASVVDGLPANNEYARYWHGSQVLIRPLLAVTSLQGCRAALFGLLLAMNAVLAVLLIRRRAVRPLVIYLAGMVMVQFWMGLFTLEYIMSFLVMTGACIAVAASWRKDRTTDWLSRRMTAICIVSGTVVCFVDFLTTETLTFTVPVLMWLMLHRESGRRLTLRQTLVLLVRWGAAWGAAYAMTFALKWGLVYAVMGKEALMNVFSSAAYRINRTVDAAGGEAAGTVRSSLLPAMLAYNIGILFPFAQEFALNVVPWAAAGVLLVLGAVLYLFRGSELDGAFIAGLLLVGLVPYARFLALSSHALDHYFFTYRAQMATLMAIMAVMAYSLKPSEVLRPSKKRRK